MPIAWKIYTLCIYRDIFMYWDVWTKGQPHIVKLMNKDFKNEKVRGH